MRYLDIRNVGPIQSVHLELKRFNVFIGAQSIGKSTIAKILSTCCWVEKEVITNMDEKSVPNGKAFKSLLEDFHKMESYIDSQGTSFIHYETEYIDICYENDNLQVRAKNNEDYLRPKICYIPSERNMVTLPELQNFEFGETNIRSFLFDWFNAREFFSVDNKAEIMNLGIKYYYDQEVKKNKDRIIHANGQTYGISLACASSGLQSLVPLLIMLKYYSNEYYNSFDEKRSYGLDDKAIRLRRILTDRIVIERYKPGFNMTERGELLKEINRKLHDGDENVNGLFQHYLESVEKLLTPHQTMFIIEEPEQNLFPNTQLDLMDTLVSLCKIDRKHQFTITTHSPYIVNYLNVLLRQTSESGKRICVDELGVYLVIGGTIQNLMAEDLDTGETVVDATGLTEQMEDIFNEYQSLGV